MIRRTKTVPLPVAERQRRHLVRYVGAGQSRFGHEKRHLSSQNYRWRLFLIVLCAIMVAAGVISALREIG